MLQLHAEGKAPETKNVLVPESSSGSPPSLVPETVSRLNVAAKHPDERSPREARGAAIATNEARPITKLARNKWAVPSAAKPSLAYVVTRYAHAFGSAKDRLRWTCTCPDYEMRGAECKHQYAVQFLLGVQAISKTPSAPIAAQEAPALIAPVVAPAIKDGRPACKFCASESVVKIGVKSGNQQYRCKACARKFVPASGFERIQADPKTVCLALDLSFKGLSLREVTDTINQFHGLSVGKSTIHRWLDRYVALLNEYADTLNLQVGDKWHADEVFVKFSGRLQYVWHLMDARTRYLLVSRVTAGRNTPDARAVFTEAKERAGKLPAEVVTDGLAAYSDAFGGAFRAGREGKAAIHTREIHISKPQKFPHNNKIERLNGTLRKRQKVARGLKKPEGPLTRGHAAYYNLIRPHQALGGKTPAEAAGAGIDGAEPRWLSRIKAAARAPPP